jgi:DNA-binding transcriptional MerR regulator
MEEQQEFSETTGSVARAVGCLPQTVRAYSDKGLVEFRRLADGTRVYRPAAVARVREILAEGMARNTKRKPAAA